MLEQTATPAAQPAEASEPTTEQNAVQDAVQDPVEQPTDKPAEEPKKEKTPEEKELARARRRIDNLTKRYHLTLAEVEQLRKGANVPSQAKPQGDTTAPAQDDTDQVTLTRSQLDELIDKEARTRAPTIAQQEAEFERRRGIVDSLAKEWGTEKFDALASDLDDAMEGLKDGQGRTKPAFEAILESDKPRALIEYLADPDHADEAKAIGRMGAVQAGRAIAKLETKLAETKATDKPQPSKAPAPIESARGNGNVSQAMPRDSDSIDVWVKKERERLAAKKGAK